MCSMQIVLHYIFAVMNVEDIREFGLSLPDTEEGLPFGPDTLVLKTNGKIFLLMGLDRSPLQFNVKCDPARAIELREEYACIQPGYHMNKKHWNTITPDHTLSRQLLEEQIKHSHELVAKKAKK